MLLLRSKPSSLAADETALPDFSFSGSALVTAGRRRPGKKSVSFPLLLSLLSLTVSFTLVPKERPGSPGTQPSPFCKNAALRSGAEAQGVKPFPGRESSSQPPARKGFHSV